METVEIVNSNKEKLIGFLEETSDEDNKKKLVIFCHGTFWAHKNNCFFPELSKKLNEAGYSVFRFDFSGYGESEGKFEENTISKNIEDLKIVVEHFKKKGYVIFSLLGHSMGGTEVLVYKSKYNDAKSVIAVAPRVIYNEKILKERYSKEQLELLETQGFFTYDAGGKSFKISKEFIDDRIKNYNDIRVQAKKILCPVLLIHGDADTTTPKEESKELIKALNKKSMLKIIPEEDHNFSNPENQIILFNSIITFLAAVNRGIF
jgi:putative redox protein